MIWRLVRESNPRLPARQAGTLATELTEPQSIRSRVPAPPNRCGRFPPSRSASSTRVPCAGVACGIRTRVPGMKPRCPGPARRTRHESTSAVPKREHPVGCGVSLHGAGQGSRTSRTANTMSRGHGVKGHTRSGADDESRTRGLDHGVVALCLLSYIRKFCEADLGQYRARLAASC